MIMVQGHGDLSNQFLYPQYGYELIRELSEEEKKELKSRAEEKLKTHKEGKNVSPTVWAHWFALVNSFEYMDNIKVLTK